MVDAAPKAGPQPTSLSAISSELRKVRNDVISAGNIAPRDKSAQTAANPQWQGGFDQKLGSKRTT